MDLKELKEIGLTSGEIKVYLCLLEAGISTKGKIAKKSGVSESKIYEILDRLSRKGLVSFIKKRKGSKDVLNFKASDPVMLKEFLEKKKEEIVREERIVDKMMPILKARMNAAEREYSAVIYEGFKGIRTANKELLESASKDDEWMGMGVRSDKKRQFNIYWTNYLRQRAAKGIKARLIFVDKGSGYFKELSRIRLTKIAYLPSVSPAAIIVFKNNVMIYNYDEHPSCLKIVNEGIAKSFRSMFEGLWKMAEPQN